MRRRELRSAWMTACKKARCLGMLRHDFRRATVRNVVNGGIPRCVAMSVTERNTRSVFDRYHMVSTADYQELARRLAEKSTTPGLPSLTRTAGVCKIPSVSALECSKSAVPVSPKTAQGCVFGHVQHPRVSDGNRISLGMQYPGRGAAW